MKIIFSIILISLYLYSNETISEGLITKYCKDEASVYKNSKRLYDHAYDTCYKKAKNYTFQELNKKKQELKIANENRKNRQIQIKNTKYIGTWLVDWGYKYKQTYFSRGNILYSQRLFSDGSGSTTMVKYKKTNNGMIKIMDVDPYGSYYIITKDKQLQFWSTRGKFYTAKKLKKANQKVRIQKQKLYIGQKVPFDKWDKYGSPETLDGTNNQFWIVYLSKINMTFKARKTTFIILSIKKGRIPNL